MGSAIIGREKEKMELKKYISSEQSEFVAIYEYEKEVSKN